MHILCNFLYIKFDDVILVESSHSDYTKDLSSRLPLKEDHLDLSFYEKLKQVGAAAQVL